ncbi:hypothetical protein [Tepidibacter hydrothermalis]|uniref:Uncharacterized protein n=1 Tax=Tepidibacter hydrothermalis TaxID=3036126 RepID=A0ABY8EH36_9FIRM|nr:hypothetical protein [Tepidibacter hydrothermalis]WFD12249.1 hypothetical protein P4S50_09230 [Tepidibacter hydrothermalis]
MDKRKNSKKEYEIIEEEAMFFDALLDKSEKEKLKNLFQYRRTSNGTFNIIYSTYPVGKIKLQGRKHWMMIMKNLYDSKTIEGTIDDYISEIDYIIVYIKKYILPELK